MAGLDEDDHPDWRDQLRARDREWDENFVKDVYPLDPMMLAFPLIETHNLTIDPQLAFQLQEIYEDFANRYLDLAAILRAYVAQERKKASSARRANRTVPALPAVSDPEKAPDRDPSPPPA